MTTYYRVIDITEYPLGTIWRNVNGQLGLFLNLAVRRLLRRPFPPSAGERRPETPLLVERADFPAEALEAMEQRAAECRELGLGLALCSKGAGFIGFKRTYGMTYLDHSKTTAVVILWLQMRIRAQEMASLKVICSSHLEDGRILSTVTCAPGWLGKISLPHVHEESVPTKTPLRDILAAHTRRLEAAGVRAIAEDRAMIIAKWPERAQAGFDHLVATGFYVPMSQKEADHLIREGWE
ncbi:MAG TPA: hypothetical protein PKJ78_17445 [Candidatus Hydrogenedentes bacterium]|nr:hypothetical protein [Candidatus Hydrogenedentota bacterium]